MPSERQWWYVVFDCEQTDKTCLSQWNVMHIVAIVAGLLSILAVIVMIATAIRFRRYFKSLSFAAQLPIYVGICDFGYEVFHIADHFYAVNHGYVIEGGVCKFLGSMKPLWINTQSAWSLACALYLFRVLLSWNEQQPTFGPRNLYLHVACWGIPVAVWIIGWSINAYGHESAWCGVVNPLVDLFMVDLWMMLVMLTLFVLYGIVVYKLSKVANSMKSESDHNAAVVRSADKIKKVVRLIGLYPLAYISQWFGYGLIKMRVIAVGPNTFGLMIYLVTACNAGGVFNCILYGRLLWNQIQRERKMNAKMASTQLVSPSSPNSAESV